MPVRFLPALIVAIVIAGSTTASASLLGTHSLPIFSGNAPVPACARQARIDVSTAYSADVGGYQLAGVYLKTSAACASAAYQITVSGRAGTPLAQLSGTIDAAGAGSQDVSTRHLAVAAITGYSVVVSR